MVVKNDVILLLIKKRLVTDYKTLAGKRKNGFIADAMVKVSDDNLTKTAGRLESPKLTTLYMEAQFHAMPREWCIKMFKRPYPPFNVCFGGACFERYEAYLKRGIRDVG